MANIRFVVVVVFSLSEL